MSITKRGDTIIEVTIAFAIYSLIAIFTIALMNNGTNTSQGSLELAMARNEIDAQAEAIRFIHNSYLSERELSTSNQDFRDIWLYLTDGGGANSGLAIRPDEVTELSSTSCKDAAQSIPNVNGFIINTRVINPQDSIGTVITSRGNGHGIFIEAPIYPRVVFSNGYSNDSDDDMMEPIGSYYKRVSSVEGIWVFSVASQNRDSMYDFPEFYDFHIRTCWYGPGRRYPSTIGTIIRLYNPELVEAAR